MGLREGKEGEERASEGNSEREEEVWESGQEIGQAVTGGGREKE